MGRKFGKSKLEKFRTSFVEKRKIILDKLNAASEDEIDIDGDTIDMIQGAALSELVSKLGERDLQQLRKLSESIEAIDNGEFGLCVDCDVAIGEKRLLALPGVDTCVNCAEDREREARNYLK